MAPSGVGPAPAVTAALILFLGNFARVASATAADKQAMDSTSVMKAERTQEAAVAMAFVQRASGEPSCGISGRLGDSGYVEFHPRYQEPVCGRPMSTNCTISYRTIRCPRSCPFIVPSATFPCLLECVSAVGCSSYNPGLALPDASEHLCRACSISNCRHCSRRDRCEECYDGFARTSDSSMCELFLERHSRFGTVLTVVFLVLLALVFLAILWKRIKGLPDHWEENNFAIRRAMRHRHMTKVQKWALTGIPRQRYPLSTDVHQEHIMGEGMALFYNSLMFLMFIGLLYMVTLWAVYKLSDTERVLGKLSTMDFLGREAVDHAVEVPGDAPAMVISPLALCGKRSSSDVGGAMRSYADFSFYGTAFLYVATFIASLFYGRRQKRESTAYKSSNSTMSDYAICLTGLPKDATNESDLRTWLQEEFTPVLGVGNKDAAGAVYGVSIGYDYTSRGAEVEGMISRLIEQEEVNMGLYTEAYTTAAAEEPSRPLTEMIQEDKQKVHAWFKEDGEDKLFSSGEAFVVFRHKAAKRAVLKRYRLDAETATVLRHPSAPHTEVKLWDVHVEPVSACWWHFGVGPKNLIWRCCIALMKIVAMILFVGVGLVMPFARFIIMPYANGGNPAGGNMFIVAGFLLGWVNMLMAIQIYFISYGLGFHRKDKRDVVIFWANLVVSLMNVGFQIFNTAVQVFNKSAEHTDLELFFEVRSLVRAAREHELAHNVYLLLLPGAFFTGYLMCPIMAGVVPYMWNMLLMKVIYVWHCLPRPLLRVLRLCLPWAPQSLHRYPVRLAEKGFEGMELGLPWDYAGNIMLPSICCTMLPLASPYVWQVFGGLLLWAVFYYFYCRYMHLRFMRAQYYTTRRVDSMANIAWGLPLSIVACSCCIWALRTGRLPADAKVWQKLLMAAGTFALSFALWVLCYLVVVDPFADRGEHPNYDDPSVEVVKETTLYSWFNCNPVYVLKCKYYVQDIDPEREHFLNPIASGHDGKSVRFFEVGKEFLFLPDEKQEQVEIAQDDSLEFETYLDAVVCWLEGDVKSSKVAAAAAKEVKLALERAEAILRPNQQPSRADRAETQSLLRANSRLLEQEGVQHRGTDLAGANGHAEM